jgi:hypothetical protein
MAQRIYPLIDRALGGTLEARLRLLREAGESYDEIAHDLRGDNITVSGETVRKWCIDLGIEAA